MQGSDEVHRKLSTALDESGIICSSTDIAFYLKRVLGYLTIGQENELRQNQIKTVGDLIFLDELTINKLKLNEFGENSKRKLKTICEYLNLALTDESIDYDKSFGEMFLVVTTNSKPTVSSGLVSRVASSHKYSKLETCDEDNTIFSHPISSNKTKGNYKKRSKLTKWFLIICCLFCFINILLRWKLSPKQTIRCMENDKDCPLQCSIDQLSKIRSQLIPNDCAYAIEKPWLQTCSFTVASACPEAIWLDVYYKNLQKDYIENSESFDSNPFVGISVGCNKGFDALNTLRMGTFDSSLSKSAWDKEMNDDSKLYMSVCGQDTSTPFEVSIDVKKRRPGEVHCFEPMTATFNKLKKSAEILRYDKKGLKVIHGAVSNRNGTSLFPTNYSIGVENIGLKNNCAKDGKFCESVNVYTLKDYIRDHVKGSIHILQIDAEGFDVDILYGAGVDVLERVEYLEFEYNWVGSWRNYHLYDIIEMLDRNNFTCYWEGKQRLWRITGCWMLYYDIHSWSNIVCVNRNRVPKLASKMEFFFKRTLLENKVWRHRLWRRLPKPYAFHDIFLKEKIFTKYLVNNLRSRYLK